MESPLLSVIIPVYNTAPWLRKCLDSVCGQTYRNLEIICVNDGSSDNSAEILAEYAAKDARVRVITQENAGLSAARNTGLKYASGQWVTGVDSDDYLLYETYSRLLPAMVAGCDMICYGIKTVYEDGREVVNDYLKLSMEGECPYDDELIVSTNAFFVNKLYRTELVRKWGIVFPEGLRHEDAAFVYSYMSQIRSIYFVTETMYCYLQRAGSITNSDRFKLRAFDFCPVLECLYVYYKSHGVLQKRRGLYPLVFVELYEDAMCGLPGNLQRRAKKLYRSMVRRCGLHREYPGEYPFAELARFSFIRSLFFWRNKTTKLYKFLHWPILRVEELPTGQKEYHWFT